MEKPQIKSRKRVEDHGEVFTNEREVNAMLDLVKDESFNIESTFLEPACGDGNFLEVILRRKLDTVKSKYSKCLPDYEKYAIVAISSLYGVDILEDNVAACIERLHSVFCKEYKSVCKKNAQERIQVVAHYILTKNILCGDALTLLKTDKTPIVFAEWKMVTNSKIKRRDFTMSKILEAESYNSELADMGGDQLSLFGTLDDDVMKEIYDSVNKPIKEYPLMNYWELDKYE